MKKSPYKIILLVVMLGTGIAFSVFMASYGVIPVLLSVLFLAFITLWVWIFFSVFSGRKFAENKLIRFTKKLKKELKQASKIYIMGHKYSDLDSVGAAYGLYYALRDTYDVKMVVNKQQTLARPLVDFLRFSDKDCQIFDYEEIAHTVDDDALLIVVDTHRPIIMDYAELYERINKVIIIDHHRKADDFVDRTVARYMKSSCSSACEIVTVIIRLLGVDKTAPVAANALFAGIMLDTKSFVMNTSPTTFRAAAFLKQNRADPVLVKKMFSESVEVCKQKYDIISDVELYGNFAIAKTESEDQYTRIATAQAADELLAINGVFASFVMCPSEDKINISARSFGDVDVQKIMARLGGGGHKTVAACQVSVRDFDRAQKLLQNAIEEYVRSR